MSLKFKNSDVEINIENVKKAKKVLRAITNALRLNLLLLIDSKGELNVTEIHNTLNLVQSVASSHLAILRAANLVKIKKVGKCVYYSVNYDRLKEADLICLSLVGES